MTSVEATSPAPETAAPAGRARVARRIQALALDVLVHGLTLIGVMSLLELLPGHRPLAGAALAGWMGLVLLYEPMLVSRWGATLGHAFAGLRIVDADTGVSPDLPRALARYWLKVSSGPVAVLYMAVSRDHQALHDVTVGTIVEETEENTLPRSMDA